MPTPKSPEEYARELESVLVQVLQPLRGVPFKAAIRAVSGCSVLDFDSANPNHQRLADKISTAAGMAGAALRSKGIATKRPNEAGNAIEPHVKAALAVTGLLAVTPKTKDGKGKAVGYPDIEITGAAIPCYLECKTYNINNVNTTQRAFYFLRRTNSRLHAILFICSSLFNWRQSNGRESLCLFLSTGGLLRFRI